MAHFYLAERVTHAVAVLEGDEARHAAQVARLRAGERVVVGDGGGRIADAEALTVARDRVVLRVLAVREVPAPTPRIVLVQALAKGGRDELAIQAATELGVSAVVPWQASRSIVRWSGPRVESGRARWASIVREAGKQAMRPWAVEVLPPTTTAEMVALFDGDPVLVLDPGAPRRLVAALPAEADRIVLVVGPEGGIAPEELALLADAGAVPVRLGATVLRTSTAGPAAVAAIAALLDVW